MTDKDNIKLKTETLSSRKNTSATGVHVKRKRKIIAKELTSNANQINKTTKKEIIKRVCEREYITRNQST